MTAVPSTAKRMSFHCSCGEPISTDDIKVTCPECGETVEVVSCKDSPDGRKYSLRISRRLREWNPEPVRWAWGSRPAPDTRMPRLTGDPNKRYTRLGALILVAPLCAYLFVAGFNRLAGGARPRTVPAGAPVVEEPQPDDCSLTRGCYYKKIYTLDSESEVWHVAWVRVNDWPF